LTLEATKNVGRVCLVGAGPGDEGLITVKGLARLREADVVVFDALANPALLEHAPLQAQRIDVGKRATAHTLTQDQTNELLADLALQGKFVVRLKGGDPYLFGRGAEEAAYLASRGVSCEVIPGVTSGLAAPAAAGIPVTHRKLASTVTLVTAHEDPTKGSSSVDYAALAALVRAGGTLCFYMGVARIGAIASALTAQGLPSETPAAIVQWGTLPSQRSVRTTLQNAAIDVTAAGIEAPAIVVVGPVAAIAEPGLDYFTSRPLFGQRILVTRTRQQASDLRLQLEELGAIVLEAPTIELVPPENWHDIDAALRDLSQFNWLVLTSANAVSVIAERLAAMNLDTRSLAAGALKIAAIGDATAQSLWDELRIKPDVVPTRFVAESLAGELIAEHDVSGKRVLLLRADIARPELPKLLAQAGAHVTELVAYQTRPAAALPSNVLDAIKQNKLDWITFSSSSTAKNLAAMLGDNAACLSRIKLASIGPVTTTALSELGLTPAAIASVSTVAGLVDAIVAAERESESGATQHAR
jgi:uroporphyrinogen III methyltransferase / synthase